MKKLQPAIERMLQTLARGVAKGVGLVKTVVEMIWGDMCADKSKRIQRLE